MPLNCGRDRVLFKIRPPRLRADGGPLAARVPRHPPSNLSCTLWVPCAFTPASRVPPLRDAHGRCQPLRTPQTLPRPPRGHGCADSLETLPGPGLRPRDLTETPQLPLPSQRISQERTSGRGVGEGGGARGADPSALRGPPAAEQGDGAHRAAYLGPGPGLPGETDREEGAPADEHCQDDGEPAELEDPHNGGVLLGDEDAGGGEHREADADQRCQVLAVCGGGGRSWGGPPPPARRRAQGSAPTSRELGGSCLHSAPNSLQTAASADLGTPGARVPAPTTHSAGRDFSRRAHLCVCRRSC